ncbi:MAG: hypothetical protein HOO67_06810 [Candidatus Peribacteraceae bacterium]|nr:hypothetical protein [Candidatus Peribacteraceae bacterium]
MPYHKYLSEFLGAFTLTFVAWVSTVYGVPANVTHMMVAATLGLYVYTVGGISGAHLNPAVTIGVLSAGKIKTNDAVMYVIFQLAGAVVAMTAGRFLSGGQMAALGYDLSAGAGIAEAIGAFILAFGVMSATLQKIPPAASGIVVGGSLFIGLYASFQFSNGILNPAVALGLNAFGPMEILGPIVGAVAGSWARVALEKKA